MNKLIKDKCFLQKSWILVSFEPRLLTGFLFFRKKKRIQEAQQKESQLGLPVFCFISVVPLVLHVIIPLLS